MSRTPEQQAAPTELQKRYGDTTDARSAEWVRVATYYNRVRPIGSLNWGDLEVDVKNDWRTKYRSTQKVEDNAEWNQIAADQARATPAASASKRMCGCGAVYIPTDLSQFADAKTMHRLAPHPCYMLEETGQYGFIPPEDIEHLPFEGGGVREGHGNRPRFELLVPLGVPFEDQLLTRCARHMARGAEKYESRNWESFSDEAALERAKASAFRHLMQWLTNDNGEDHAAAVVFNLMAAEHVAAKLAKAERKCAPEKKVCDD